MSAPGRAYRGESVTVFFDARRCLHVAECIRGLPGVFDTDKRPWIQPDNADALEVAEVVRRCPTGALHYALASGNEEAGNEKVGEETGDPTTQITLRPNGPLMIRGRLEVSTPDGTLQETRAALCRCGQSGNKPFCDGTHSKVGWQG